MMKFIIFSRRLIESAIPYDKPHIIISIRTPGDPNEVKLPVGDFTLASLRLDFQEEYENEYKERHALHVKKGSAFTIDMGKYIINFVERYATKIEAIILHCDAGLARSPGIAYALSKTIFAGKDNKFFKANQAQDDMYEEFILDYRRFPTCSKYIFEAYVNSIMSEDDYYKDPHQWWAPEELENHECSLVDCWCEHCKKCNANLFSMDVYEPCSDKSEAEFVR